MAWVVIAAAVIAVLVGVDRWWSTERNTARTRVVEGWAYANLDSTAIALSDRPDGGEGEGYSIADAQWWSAEDDSWHEGGRGVDCATPLKITHVQLGVVRIRDNEGGGREMVAWVRCLE